MQAELARQILVAAREGGYLEQEVPEADEDAISLAEYYAKEARKALATGMNEEAIERIVNIADGKDVETVVEEPDEPAPAEEEEEPVQEVAQAADSSDKADSTPPQDRAPRGANLPVPPEIEGEATPLPRDLTGLDDREIRRLHGEYNAFLARATWLVSIASTDHGNYTFLRDEALRKAISAVPHTNAETGKPRTRASIEAEAAGDDSVLEYGHKVFEAARDLEQLKALKEIYKGHVDRLSREWTMRTDEFERSGK